MSKVILIRPGRTDYDDQSRLLGTLEMPLNQQGEADLSAILEQLKSEDLKPQIILTSPTDPALMTAQQISAGLGGIKVRELEELRNVDQGLWQGLREPEVRKRYPQFFRVGKEKPQTICPPQGETLCDAAERMQKVLNKGIRKYSVLAIVAPEPVGSVIRCILQERGLQVSDCLSGEGNHSDVECFNADRFDSENFINWEVCHDSHKPVTSSSPEDQ